jgi:hypothetical protein
LSGGAHPPLRTGIPAVWAPQRVVPARGHGERWLVAERGCRAALTPRPTATCSDGPSSQPAPLRRPFRRPALRSATEAVANGPTTLGSPSASPASAPFRNSAPLLKFPSLQLRRSGGTGASSGSHSRNWSQLSWLTQSGARSPPTRASHVYGTMWLTHGTDCRREWRVVRPRKFHGRGRSPLRRKICSVASPAASWPAGGVTNRRVGSERAPRHGWDSRRSCAEPAHASLTSVAGVEVQGNSGTDAQDASLRGGGLSAPPAATVRLWPSLTPVYASTVNR